MKRVPLNALQHSNSCNGERPHLPLDGSRSFPEGVAVILITDVNQGWVVAPDIKSDPENIQVSAKFGETGGVISRSDGRIKLIPIPPFCEHCGDLTSDLNED